LFGAKVSPKKGLKNVRNLDKTKEKELFCFSKKRNNWILPSVSGLMRRLCDTARAF
jgi:hypothetical protein